MLEYGHSRAHDVSLIAPGASALHQACAQIGVRSEAAEFSLAPSSVIRLRRLMRELRPDIVHGMSIFPVALVRRLGLVPSARHACFFAHVNVDPTSLLPVAAKHFRRLALWLRNTISRLEAPRLDAVFAVSETVARRLSAAGISGRIITTPGHVDVDKLETEATEPLDLPPGHPRVGYVGYLEPLKGVDDLVVAFADVLEHSSDAVLLVAGDGPERGRLLDLAQRLGVAGRLHLLGHLEPVAPLLRSLDVFASPSHSEALGASILEAMALGIPCVCTDSGGPAEFVRDGGNGLLVPIGNPEALAAAIRRLLDDRQLASRIAQHGRDTILDGPYLISRMLETVFAEYERAVQRSGNAA